MEDQVFGDKKVVAIVKATIKDPSDQIQTAGRRCQAEAGTKGSRNRSGEGEDRSAVAQCEQ